jgi:hypothetical protein
MLMLQHSYILLYNTYIWIFIFKTNLWEFIFPQKQAARQKT